MKKIIRKKLIAVAMSIAMLTQSAGLAASAESYKEDLQPLTLTQIPFTEAGVETARSSSDTQLLEIYNRIRAEYPVLDGDRLILPETGSENYVISLYGSSNKAVIDMDGNVTQPLEDMQVYLYYKVVNVQTGEELHMDDPIIVEINGLYEDSRKNLNRPQIMPGIREWKGCAGTFTFSGKLVLAEESLRDAAGVAAEYIEGMTGTAVTLQVGTPAAGDIYIAWDKSLNVGSEGYVLSIDDILTVTATDYTGVVYAGATITQMLMDGMTIPKGLMRDYPQYEIRASMLDIARFYMPMDYLYELTKYSAFFKFNEFHAHINDNNGEQNYAFRVESKVYPQINNGVPADEIYSQEEYRQYQKDMKKYCIDIITEIDTPAHARFAAAYDSSLMLDDTRIDIRKPEAIEFIKNLVDEFLDGEDPIVQSDSFHIGIDEYDYTYADEIREYTNDICAYIADKGYTARVWCSNSKTITSEVELDNSIVQTVYAHHAADMTELLEIDAPMINDHSKYLYVVPVTSNGCNDYISLEKGFKDWEAGRINTPTNPVMTVIQPGHPLMLGAESTVWYDDKVGASEFDIFSRYKDQIMLVAEKTWFGKKTAESTYENFMERVEKYWRVTPLANPGRYIPSEGNLIADYDFTVSTADTSGNGYDATLTGLSVTSEGLQLDGNGYVTLPFRGIGFPYCVDFTLQVTEAPENALLFDGRDGKLFLNYDGTGKLGLERKGYRFVFDYQIPENIRLDLRLVCKDEKTYLYVEGALIGEAQLYKTWIETYGSTSFVIPGEKIGSGITGNLYSLTIAKNEYDTTAGGSAEADKSSLRAALDQVVEDYPYSAETATVYQQAVQMAETVYADPGADQTKVDWAQRQLQTAEDSLSLVHSIRHSRALCPHCGKTQEEIVWEPWSFQSGTYITRGGHYYLTGDVTVTTQVAIGAGSSGTEAEAIDLVLDLNGYSFINKTARCFFVSPYCTFSIMDSGGTGTVSGGGKSNLTGGTVFVHTAGNLRLYGGTVTVSGATTKNAGVIHVTAGSFIMYSGLIYGGKTLSEDAAAEGNGGNVNIVKGSRFEMHGGAIVGGVSTNKGGNVYVNNESVMEMHDGLIMGGTSNTDVGGNVFIGTSTFKMYGGTIRDGYAVNSGNIGNESGSVFEISGGLITGGVAKRYGGNMLVNNKNAQVTISGGHIDGDLRIYGKITLSGSPYIGLGGSNGLVIVSGGGNVNISGLNADARIYVSRTANGVFTAGYDAAKHADCFLGAVRSTVTVDASGQLRIDSGNTGYCPHCGKLVTWEAWTPANAQTINKNVHYYLSVAKTDITSQIKIGAHMAADNEVVIDLNGKNLAASSRVFYVNSSLCLMDSAGYGTVTGNHATASGAVALGRSNAKLSVYSGIYTASSSGAGSVFAMSGETKIYGGAIDGSKITKEADGGALKVGWGTLTIYAGRIIGGKTTQGGAVYFHGDNDKGFDMYGGVITGGQSYKLGGNVYIGNEGIFFMRGGLIQDGTGDVNNTNSGYDSDNVYVDSGRKLVLSGGYILGSASDYKGNAITTWTECIVVLDGDPTVLNTAKSGNLYVGSTAQLIVKETFRGRVYSNIQAQHLTSPYYGTTLAESKGDRAEGVYSGSLWIENVTLKPRIFGGTDGKLWIAGAAAVGADNTVTWYKDADTAAKNAVSGTIRLYAKDTVLTETALCPVDLNGQSLTLTGSARVIDRATGGKVTVTGGTLRNPMYTTAEGEGYVTLRAEDGSYSLHKLKMSIDSVALRPGAAGIYYGASWQYGEVLGSRIQKYGIAVSLTDQPDGYFETDPDTLYTQGSTSALIANILTEGAADNAARAEQKIYAAAYIVLDDGTAIVSQQPVAYSLRDVITLLDRQAYSANAEVLEAFYETWQDTLSGWELTNIGK